MGIQSSGIPGTSHHNYSKLPNVLKPLDIAVPGVVGGVLVIG